MALDGWVPGRGGIAGLMILGDRGSWPSINAILLRQMYGLSVITG